MQKTDTFLVEHWKNLSLKNIIYADLETGAEKVEEWKDIVEYEGMYQVSDLGRIKSLKRLAHWNLRGQRELPEKIKPSFNDKGYRRVELSKEGINTKY